MEPTKAEKRARAIAKARVRKAELEDLIQSHERQMQAATIVFVFSLLLSPVLIGLVLLPFSLVNYFRHKGKLKALRDERIELTRKLATVDAV